MRFRQFKIMEVSTKAQAKQDFLDKGGDPELFAPGDNADFKTKIQAFYATLTKKNPEDGLLVRCEQTAYLVDERVEISWVARTVADHHAVSLGHLFAQIGRPRYSSNAHAALQERPHHVVFGAHVDERDLQRSAFVVDSPWGRHELEDFFLHFYACRFFARTR